MSLRRDGQDPSGYIGVVPVERPRNIIAERAPTTNDRRYKIGTLWIDKSANASYQLTSVVAASANWQVLGSPTSAVATITGDTGGALSPTAGNINILGTAAQGLSFSGSGSTLTGTISDATTSQKGVLETATNTEANNAALTDKALVPANLAALTADNLAALTADNGNALDGSSTSVYLTPAAVKSLKDATDITWTQSPLLQSNANTGIAPTGSTGDVNLMISQEGELMEQFIMGAGQTIIAPRMNTNGLLVSLDLVDDEGAEYNWGARANAKHVYTIATDPAFRLTWRFRLADVTGCDPVGIGFRIVAANDGTLENYTDFAFIGVSETDNSGTVTIKTRLNSGAVSNTDTTDAWADGETHTLSVLVDGAGAVTYEIDGAAPTATAAFTFDSGDAVMPFFHGLHGTTAPGAWEWVSCVAGVQ